VAFTLVECGTVVALESAVLAAFFDAFNVAGCDVHAGGLGEFISCQVMV